MRAAGVWAICIGGVVVAGAVVVGAIALNGATTTENSAPSASAPSTPNASSPDSSTPPTDAAPPAIPQTCDLLYSDATTSAFEQAGRVLNPAWITSEPPRYPSIHESVNAQLASSSPLLCDWEAPEGGSEVFALTSVSRVTAEEQAALLSELKGLDFPCVASDGGQLCSQRFSDERYAVEEHFFREGVWIATLRVEINPAGYTADIVAHLFPDATPAQ